ncbi:MAG: leucine--tRNA ligase [Candidatus Aenigmarchaeota archaeon]|nr:leucine--tRNA ligase [Candidatus Aenigmarchaeota archaeon]
MNVRTLEKKWQQRWEKAKLFEANPSKKKKFFTSIVIPYVNGNVHIGHSFTFSRTDTYARFKRMQGYNVLLAQGFHATGEPILGAIERLRNGDKSQTATFTTFGATARDLEAFKKHGPEYAARFWAKKITESAKLMGFSVDWRRTFITAVEPTFNRFIEWQYNTLREKGYVVQGTHPVIWCPHCQSPTGDHDRLKGEGESPIEFTILKFAFKDMYLCAATLRPETVFGQTNMWVNPEVEYVIALVNGREKWIVSKECAEKLKDQLKKIQVVGSIKGKKMVGKYCTAPVINKDIPILPSKFCNPKIGTGLVTSVPSHAPFDWQGLVDLRNDPAELEKYGLHAAIFKDLEPISIIHVEGFGEHPAEDVIAKLGVKNQEDYEKLKEALRIIYKKEHHTGVMKANCGAYAGLPVETAKEKIKQKLLKDGLADIIWEPTEEVVCRCTTPNHVKILENQWFLKYSDEEWKKRVLYAMKKMRIIPDEARNNFDNTVQWLRDKACTRKTGLGTPLPWDKEWIVETLSDSTVYMAYYTIAHLINGKKIAADKLTDSVFDYVFLGKGNPRTVSKSSGVALGILQLMRREFTYFYPVDFRNSGKDLIQNHLTFYIFQHAAIWPERYWPRTIGVNGFVSVEGEKMSKSKGNIIPLKDLIEQYGADLTRLNIVSSSEGIDDADWRAENIKSLEQRYDYLFWICKNIGKASKRSVENEERYLMSKVQKTVAEVTEHYEQLRFRTGIQHALFDTTNALKWYLNRTGGIAHANKAVLKEAMSTIARMLAPVTPHLCEELWTYLGKGFVSVAGWPAHDTRRVNREAELAEELVHHVIEDVDEIKKIAKVAPKTISLFVAEDWKFDVYDFVLKNKGKPINEITKHIMQGDMKRYGNTTVAFVQHLYKRINELKPVLPRKRQLATLAKAKAFLEKETNCTISIAKAEASGNPKARQASPQKPGILLE